MAAYLHKKFKKYATSDQKHEEKKGPSSDGDQNQAKGLKHSVGNLVGPEDDGGGGGLGQTLPPAGPRPPSTGLTHPPFELQRQYYCDICRGVHSSTLSSQKLAWFSFPKLKFSYPQ